MKDISWTASHTCQCVSKQTRYESLETRSRIVGVATTVIVGCARVLRRVVASLTLCSNDFHPTSLLGPPIAGLAGAIILAQVAVHRTADPPLPSVNSSANSARVDRNGDVALPFLRLHLSRRRQVANEFRSRIWHPALRVRRAVRAQQP
jgi:hypothetical protein